MTPLRIVFMGTAELACPALKALVEENGFDIAAVVTQPDRPKGRDMRVQGSAVKSLAMRHAIPVLQPARARDEKFLGQLRELTPDLIVVVAYGQLLPASILNLPAHGCLNVHASLLPKYRGAAPIQWAILNDDAETGVTIMKMEEGLDTGPILSQKRTPISPGDNAQSLHNRLAEMGASLLVTTIPRYIKGEITPQPQPAENSSYARKIVKEDGRLQWTFPARSLWNQIRAFTPWPGSYTYLANGDRSTLVKIWEADVLDSGGGSPGRVEDASPSGIVVSCGTGCLRILSLQREGGKHLRVKDFLSGCPLQEGSLFLSQPSLASK